MATSLASLVVELAANTARFERDMTKAAAHARTAGNNIQRALGGIDRTFTTLTRSVTAFAGTLGVVTSVGGLTLLGKQALSFADELDEMSQRLGINVESLQAWQFAAKQTGGTTQQLERAFRTLADTLGDATRGDPAAIQKFKDMGVSFEAGAGKAATFEEMLARVAEKVAGASTQVEKINIVNKAFGDRVGTFLLPILDRGAKGFQEWMNAAREAGVIVDTKMIQQAGKAKDMLDAMATSIMANLVPAIVAVSPHLITLAQKITDVATAVGRYFSSFVDPQHLGLDEINRQISELEAEATKLRKSLAESGPPEDFALGGWLTFGGHAARKNLDDLKKNEERLAALRTARDKLTGTPVAPPQRGTLGFGENELKARRVLGEKFQDEALEGEDFAKKVLGIQRAIEQAHKDAPRFAKDIDAIGAEWLKRAADADVLAKRIKHMGEAATAEQQVEAEMAQETAEAWGFHNEQVLKAFAEEEAALKQADAQLVEYAQGVSDATQAAQEFEANLPKTALQQFNDEMAVIAARAEVFGETMGAIAEQANLVRREIERLLALGIKPTSETIKRLQADLEELKSVLMIEGAVKDFFGAFDQALTQSIAGVIQGTTTMREAFDKMGQSIALSLIQNVIRRGINEVEKAVIELVAQLVKSGLWSFMQPGAAAQAQAAPLMVGAGSGIPGGAEGAFVKHSPGGSLMVVGEGGKDEAILPLDRLPDIRGGSGGNVYVTVVNNTASKVSTREQDTPDGREIQILVESIVDNGISSGRFDRSARGAWNLSRSPVRR